jgi:hypothetical protein
MAEPLDTVNKLQKSFDKGGPELSRYDLANARQILTEHAAKQPHNSRLPWWIQRVDNRLHFMDTGEARPEPAKPASTPREKAAGWAVIGVFALLVGGCALAVSGGDDDTSSGDDRNDGMAKVMCENFVEDRLKAPGTADFSGIFDTSISGSGNSYTVSGYVDAQNSFGAKIRSDYTCQIRDNGNDQWSLVSLTGLQ